MVAWRRGARAAAWTLLALPLPIAILLASLRTPGLPSAFGILVHLLPLALLAGGRLLQGRLTWAGPAAALAVAAYPWAISVPYPFSMSVVAALMVFLGGVAGIAGTWPGGDVPRSARARPRTMA